MVVGLADGVCMIYCFSCYYTAAAALSWFEATGRYLVIILPLAVWFTSHFSSLTLCQTDAPPPDILTMVDEPLKHGGNLN